MNKKRPTGPSSDVEALMDERDDLMIRISLAADAPAPDAERLFEMQQRLIQVERRIAELSKALF